MPMYVYNDRVIVFWEVLGSLFDYLQTSRRLGERDVAGDDKSVLVLNDLMSAQKRKIPVQMTAMMTDVKNVVTFSVRKYVPGRPRMHAIENTFSIT